jgi:NADH:ubiquinone oxidoreductase subunit 4 (subunit M)
MKALILYVVFVVIGGLISTAIGYYVEIEVSSTASLIVFLALFFSNFVVSWIAPCDGWLPQRSAGPASSAGHREIRPSGDERAD